MFISSAFAQTAPAAAGGDMQSTLMNMLPMLVIFGVLYLVMIRPQMKKQKEHKAMIESIGKGDEVVTWIRINGRDAVQLDQRVVPAVFLPLLAAGGLDEDAAHGLGCRGEEVPAVLPAVRIGGAD